MVDKKILSIDFGHENIRFAQGVTNATAPQIYPPLYNAVRIDRNQGVQSVGNSVHDGIQSGSLLRSVNLFDRQVGSGTQQALHALLQEVYRLLEMHRWSAEQKEQYETVFSLPIGSSSDFPDIALPRLLEQKFPQPRALPASKAIFLSYFSDKKFQPGKYLIIDCGAMQTRVSLVQVDGSIGQWKPNDDISGETGGDEINTLLYNYFAGVLNDPQINRAELLDFTRKFKMDFLGQIKQGNTKHVTRSPFVTGVPVIDLELSEFEEMTKGYFIAFERFVIGFLERQKTNPNALHALLLAGGNAHWPFVVDLAERMVGKNKLLLSQYPEEAIVRGLSLTFVATGDVQPVKPKKPRIQPPTRLGFPLWLALLLESFLGLFGVLGVGWLIGTRTVFGLSWKPWIILLLVWPTILVLTAIFLLGASFQFSDWTPLVLFLPLWCGVPLGSGLLAYWIANKKNRR
jgi:hypothetical protein